MRLRNITSAVMCFIDTDALTVSSPNIFRLDGLLLFCITMGLPFARCELRYHSLSPTFYIKEELKGSRSPPLTLPHPYTPYEQRALCHTLRCPDDWARACWIRSLFFKSLIHNIFLTEFSVASFLFISSNQCRRNGRQANLYVRGKVEEQSFTYPHQR